MAANIKILVIAAIASIITAAIVGFVAIAYTTPPTATARETVSDLSGYKIEKIGSSDLGQSVVGRLRALGAIDSSLTTKHLAGKGR